MELDRWHWKAGHVWTLCDYQFHLDNQSVYLKRHRLLGKRSVFLGFHFFHGECHRKKHADLSRCYFIRSVIRGLLCRFSFDFYSGTRYLCQLYRTYQKRNDKGGSCDCQFRTGIYPVRFLHCLCAGLHCENQ